MKVAKKKLCMVLMMLLFISLPVSNVYAEETTEIESIKGESFAEYTERIMRAEAEAAGMTYEEYMQMKRNNNTNNTQVITEVNNTENTENTEEKIDILKVLISFLATMQVYTIVPVVFRIYHNSALEKKKAFKIALINSLIIGLFFAVLTINSGEKWTASTCVLYFCINNLILGYKGKLKE